MPKHLNTERISALLDEPEADLEAQGHLEACEVCRAEFERLSRLRMALSGLGELDPPPGEWAAIEAVLDSSVSRVPPTLRRRVARRLAMSGPLQAAAALALFAGGVLAGLQFTGFSAVSVAGDPAAGSPDLPAVISSTNEDRELLEGLAQLESLRAPLRQAGLDGDEPFAGRLTGAGDGFETAQLVARLDGLIRAMRERLENDPDDPVANAYLIELTEERARLVDEIEAASLATRTVTW